MGWTFFWVRWLDGGLGVAVGSWAVLMASPIRSWTARSGSGGGASGYVCGPLLAQGATSTCAHLRV